MNDCKPWDPRAYEAERANAVARGHDLERWHCDNDSHVRAWRQSAEYAARPFRFEALSGKPEPERWGPAYPKTASAAVESWRAIARGRELSPGEAAAYGSAVHDWIRSLNNPKRRAAIPDSDLHYEFSSAKHRAALRAKFAADAARDRREWASGKSKGFAVGEREMTIREVYERAMRAKEHLAIAAE
jgi:hypothetical protein